MSTSDVDKHESEHVERDAKAQHSASPDETEWRHEDAHVTWRTWLAILIASIASFSQILTVSGVAGVISFIIEDMGTSDGYGWIIAGPTVVQAALSPIVARLSDLTGQRKWFVVGPTVLGIVGSIIGYTAKSMPQVIAAQVVIGFGITVVGLTSSIPSELLPHRYRSWAQSTVLFASNAASVVGSVGTGAMVRQEGGWRLIYVTLIVSYGVTFLGFLFLYNPAPPPNFRRKSFGEIFHQSDAVGSLLLTCGLGLFLIALNWGGTMYPWSGAGTVAPLVLGGVLIIAFLLYEWKGRSDGILDHRIFRFGGRNFTLAAFGLFVEGYVYFGAVAGLLPREIRGAGWASDGVLIGARSLIFTAAAFLTAWPMSFYVTKTKDPRTPLAIGYTLFTVSVIMLSQASPGKSGDNLVMGALAVGGVGFSAPLVLLNMVVQLSAPPELIASVTALVASARALAGSFGSAVVVAIQSNKFAARMPELVAPAALQAGLPESSLASLISTMFVSPAAITAIEGVTPQVVAAVLPPYYQATTFAYSFVWYSLIPWCAVAVIAMVCLRSVKDKMTWQIDRRYEGQAPTEKRIDEP